MGIHADTNEDNLERQGQFYQSDLTQNDSSKPENPVAFEKCPYCFKQFLSSELDFHIFNEHQGQYIYLRVNDSIIRDDYSVLWIEKLEIGLLGYNSAEIEISGSNFVNEFTINKTFDVTSAIPIGYEGEIKIKVIIEQKIDKEYVIYNKSIPEFKNEELDALILEWQKELELSSTDLNYNPDFKLWKSQFGDLPKTTFEDRRYFDGFYEYGIGSNLERKEKYSKAKSRLESAFGLLLPFETTLSKTIVRLLGLKMNCFYVLKNCSPQSLFAPADAIFNKNQKPSEVVFTKTQLSGTGIFIDSFSHLFLDTLSVFYNNSDNQISVLLNALKRHPHSKEKNNADKLQLLAARYYKYSGEHQKAIEEFSFLKYHPHFGKEAKLYLNQSKQK